MHLGSISKPQTRSAVALGPHEGERVWFHEQLVVVKLRGVGAPFGLIETALDAGRGAPFHRHTDEDEAFYVLEGELTVHLEGGRKLRGSPGTFVHLPRGVAHGFRTDTAARLLVLSNPTGFVDFTREYGVPASGDGPPPPAEPDFPRLERIARKYRIELLGPLPA